jgi:hypothetical protein
MAARISRRVRRKGFYIQDNESLRYSFSNVRLGRLLVGVTVCAGLACAAEISGVVLDWAGEPLAGARVFAAPLDHPGPGILPETSCDSKGRFHLMINTAYGRQELWTYNEASGFPKIYGTFWSRTNPPACVNVRRPHAIVRNVVVRTGPPPPAWISGHIADAVRNGEVNKELVDDPVAWERQSVSSPFKIAIPANVRVRLRFSAPERQAFEIVVNIPPRGVQQFSIPLRHSSHSMSGSPQAGPPARGK